MLTVIASSDFHGTLPEINNPFDLFLICGDVCPVWNHNRKFQQEWLDNEFVEWINNLPFKNEWSKVIMVFGNHDFIGESMSKKQMQEFESKTMNRVVVLKNDTYEFDYDDGKFLHVFGTPYCKIFGNWAFMRSNDYLDEKYGMCPEGVDIFISHDSPSTNNLGTIQEGWSSGTDAGNVILSKHIERVKPKYFFSGHIHSGNHEFTEYDGTKMANVSYLNERYNPVFEPLIFEIEEK